MTIAILMGLVPIDVIAIATGMYTYEQAYEDKNEHEYEPEDKYEYEPEDEDEPKDEYEDEPEDEYEGESEDEYGDEPEYRECDETHDCNEDCEGCEYCIEINITPLVGIWITFDANGGVSLPGHEERETTSGGIIGNNNMPIPPTMPNFAFREWNFNRDGSGDTFTGNTRVTESTTVYAQWGHMVRFAGNGANINLTCNNPNSPTCFSPRIPDAGYSVAEMEGMVWPNNPTRNGWTFVGWFDTPSQTGGNEFNADEPITRNVDLYARWILNPIATVTFDGQGATGGTLITTPNNTTRESYRGWGIFNSSTSNNLPSPDYRLNGGSGTLPNVTRTDWTFIDWSTDPNAGPVPSSVRFNSSTTVHEDMTVYAIWAHRVTLNVNGGTIGLGSRDVFTSGSSVGDYGTLPDNLNRDGFTFLGWSTRQTHYSTASIDDVDFFNDTPVYRNMTVWAVWVRNPDHTLTFDVNGGVQSNSNHILLIPDGGSMRSTNLVFPLHPTRVGYVFMGWFNNAQGEGPLFTREHVFTEDLTVYARWMPAVTVTFDLNTGAMPSNRETRAVAQSRRINQMNYQFGSSTNSGYTGLSFPSTFRSGFQFIGWNTAPDGSGSPFSASTVVTENITVYAVWAGEVIFTANVRSVSPTALPTVDIRHNVIIGQTMGNHHTHPHLTYAYRNFNLDEARELFDEFWDALRLMLPGLTDDEILNMFFPGLTMEDAFNQIAAPRPPGPLLFPTPLNWGTSFQPTVNWEWVFKGWNTQSNGQGEWFDDTFVITGNTTVYAIWSTGLTFNSGFAPANVIALEHRERVIEWGTSLTAHPDGVPPNPSEWPGHRFYGWNTQPNGLGVSFDPNANIYQPRMWFAVWVATVTFDPTSGRFPNGYAFPANPDTGRPASNSSEITTGRPLGQAVPIPPPVRDNWIFGSWNDMRDGSGITFTANNPNITRSLTLYAQWNARVTFELNGGRIGSSTLNPTRDVREGGSVAGHISGMPANPVHPQGWEFLGWFLNGEEFNPGMAITDGNITVHAHWQRAYPVDFFLDWDDIRLVSRPIINYGAAITDANVPVPTRDDWSFLGWREFLGWEECDVNGYRAELSEILTRSMVGDHIVTASRIYIGWWTQNPVEVTFILDGGTYNNSTDNVVRIIEYGAAINEINVPETTREGWILLGWRENNEGATLNRETVGEHIVTTPRSYTAQWKEDINPSPTFNVTYSVTGSLAPATSTEVPATAIHHAGTTVTVAPILTTTETTHNGVAGIWTFNGWTVPTGLDIIDYEFTMPNNDVEFAGYWTFNQSQTPPPGGGGGGGGGSWQQQLPRPNAPTTPLRVDAVPLTPYHLAYIIGNPDGYVRPNNNITRAEVTTIFFRLISDEHRANVWSQENPYSDVALDNWFNNSVSTLTNADLIFGYPDGYFRPNQAMTRAEFAALVVRIMGYRHATGVQPGSFTDTSGHWAEGYINVAHMLGWIQGYGDTTFRPNQFITRAEVAALVNRALGRLPEHAGDLLPDMVTWPDNSNPNAWYFLYIQEATNSHHHEMKACGIHETWTELLLPREWWRLERPYSTPYIFTGAYIGAGMGMSN